MCLPARYLASLGGVCTCQSRARASILGTITYSSAGLHGVRAHNVRGGRERESALPACDEGVRGRVREKEKEKRKERLAGLLDETRRDEKRQTRCGCATATTTQGGGGGRTSTARTCLVARRRPRASDFVIVATMYGVMYVHVRRTEDAVSGGGVPGSQHFTEYGVLRSRCIPMHLFIAALLPCVDV